jgi:hypothetical protein
MRIEIFQAIGKRTGQAIQSFREYYFVIGRFELLPFEASSILAILIKLGIQAGQNEQKQDESHPAFGNLLI